MIPEARGTLVASKPPLAVCASQTPLVRENGGPTAAEPLECSRYVNRSERGEHERRIVQSMGRRQLVPGFKPRGTNYLFRRVNIATAIPMITTTATTMTHHGSD
jgi:hypothetical protein